MNKDGRQGRGRGYEEMVLALNVRTGRLQGRREGSVVKTLATLPEDWGSISVTLIVAHTCL